jgi:RNA polymerase sigma factor (TIGR02999 family)
MASMGGKTMANPELYDLSSVEITQLLEQSRHGDQAALNKAMTFLHGHLHQLAERHLRRESKVWTLSATGLINETFLRLFGKEIPSIENRSHVLGLASHVMRQLLVEQARRRQAGRRAIGAEKVTLSEIDRYLEAETDVVAVNDALNRLAEIDPRQARVVELKFFGGLTLEEIATMLDLSSATVTRDWRMARHWLRQALDEQGQGRGSADDGEDTGAHGP